MGLFVILLLELMSQSYCTFITSTRRGNLHNISYKCSWKRNGYSLLSRNSKGRQKFTARCVFRSSKTTMLWRASHISNPPMNDSKREQSNRNKVTTFFVSLFLTNNQYLFGFDITQSSLLRWYCYAAGQISSACGLMIGQDGCNSNSHWVHKQKTHPSYYSVFSSKSSSYDGG